MEPIGGLIKPGGALVLAELKAWREREHLKAMEGLRDRIAADRRLGQDLAAWQDMRYHLSATWGDLDAAMRDPELSLDCRSHLEAARAGYEAVQARTPVGVREDAERLFREVEAAGTACEGWTRARARFEGRPSPSGEAAVGLEAEHGRLLSARDAYEQAWAGLRDAGRAMERELPALDDYAQAHFGVERPATPPAWLQGPRWSEAERGAAHMGSVPGRVKAESARLERLGRPPADFSGGLHEPQLAWLAATRRPHPEAGRYAASPDVAARIDELWADRAHRPDFPAMSDETKLQVLESAYPELQAEAARCRAGLADPDAPAAQPRQELVVARAAAARPGIRQALDGAGRSVSDLGDPERALESARQNQARALADMQRLAHGNQEDAWRQARADLEQAGVDEAIALSSLGRLEESARQELVDRLRAEQGRAQSDWLKARVSDDKEGIRAAASRLQQAKRDERLLTHAHDPPSESKSWRRSHA
ncbi:MAG: hypothetical protein ACREPA_07625 [Candidatus Dormibacteraceae bacterium]